MKVKVCGITTIEQLQQLQELDVDYAGLIFYEKSKRYAYEKLKTQKSKVKSIPLEKVGVFVNADMGFLKSCVVDFGLTAVQLHGDETPQFCEALQKEVEVIKVFRINNKTTDVDALVEPFQNASAYFLFDTDTESYGGSGQRFDWTLLEKAKIGKPFFLSGGIGPDDVERLKRFQHPHLYAIDVNSRFETAPGLKDLKKIKTFVHALKQPVWTK